MTAPELKPCPFCGGEADIWRAHECRTAWIACMGKCVVLISKEYVSDDEAIAAWNRRADLAAVQPAQVCPECSNTGLRDTGGVYPWGEGIFVACDHDEPQPDPRDEVIARLVEAVNNVITGRGMFGIDPEADLHWALTHLRAALEPQPDPRDDVIARLVEALEWQRDQPEAHPFMKLQAEAALAAAKAVLK